ncbi:MAG: hypothetical protein KJP23_25385 [Deltaproteobacteria bacterium]|nr:hypothetical protein [Deltaproteobacteria bacterium]
MAKKVPQKLERPTERAILVNIEIMRAFTRLRNMLASREDLKSEIEEMEKRYD